ncbi:MAG: T9SS type A sorting domain-containing protein [Flavobacterium sp.]
MRRILLSTILILLSFLKGSSQDFRNSKWYSGNNGYDFNTDQQIDTPSGLDSGYGYYNSYASVCDNSGNPLIVTDGNKVMITNGSGGLYLLTDELKAGLSNESFLQNTIIIPKPETPSVYYIITISGNDQGIGGGYGFNQGLFYSEVNVSNGTIQNLNIPLKNPNGVIINESYGNSSNAITSTVHADGINYWLVASIDNGSGNSLFSYKITSNGISNTPFSYFDIGFNSQATSLKISLGTNSQKIACSAKYGGTFYGTFNNATGEIILPNSNPYGYLSESRSVEFSPDGNILYCLSNSGELRQVLFNTNNIDITDQYSIAYSNNFRSLQLSMDNRIFINGYNYPLNYILNPNQEYVVNIDYNYNFGYNISSMPQLVPFNSCTSSVTPSFSPISPICSGSSVNPLVTTSIENISGHWSPEFKNTETITYTFTPNPGQCANTATMTITVNPITPTFNSATSICFGATLDPLPATSTNGIIGSWSQSLNNTATTDYIFTPNSGQQCAVATTLSIAVNDCSEPQFPTNGTNSNWVIGNSTVLNINNMSLVTNETIAPFNNTSGYASVSDDCGNLVFVTNGVDIWRYINNSYIKVNNSFSLLGDNDPEVKQNVIIIPNPNDYNSYYIVTAGYLGVYYTEYDLSDYDYDGLGYFCNINEPLSTSPCTALCPALNTNNEYTLHYYNQSSQTFNSYLFGYNGITQNGNFGLNYNLPIYCNINYMKIAPDRDLFAYSTDQGHIVSGRLSDTNASLYFNPIDRSQSITGLEFSPDSQKLYFTNSQGLYSSDLDYSSNVIESNSNAYSSSFTGYGSLQLANNGIIYGVNHIYPTFLQISDSGISVIDTGGSANGSLSLPQRIPINTNNFQPLKKTPYFSPLSPLCKESSVNLPSTSLNSITGTWSLLCQEGYNKDYRFIPNSCANSSTMNIKVIQPQPVFNQISPICSGNSINLPTTSVDGVTGNWSPAINNTVTTTYTFTPNPGQCGTGTTSMTVEVKPRETPTFNVITPICQGSTIDPLPSTSTNYYTGRWSPTLNNTATTTYTFTPYSNQCAYTTTKTITIVPSNVSFTGLKSSFCSTEAAVTLVPSLSGGIFSGAGVSGNIFTPSAAGSGNININYAFINENNPLIGNYSVNNIPFASLSATGTTVSLGYDQVSAALPVGFNFSFYGNTYSKFYISSNGFISFSPLNPGAIPNVVPENDDYNNIIAAAWGCDYNINLGGTITYYTTGIAPNRKMVISFNNIKYYDGIDSMTSQIILYESSNQIEIHTSNVSNDNSLQTQGIENATGTLGAAVPGRNNTIWAANNDAYRFVPITNQCGASTQTITVNQAVNPAFHTYEPICSGVGVGTLPTTSLNGISGTWSPPLNSTATTNYTFTPNSGQCANTANMSLTVIPSNVTFSGLKNNYFSSEAAVTLIPSIAGGTFSGPGVSGNTFTPSAAGTGQVTIHYGFNTIGNYNVHQINYALEGAVGTNVDLTNNQVSTALPIGFNFNFYGNLYNHFYISSNGFISFDPAVTNGCCYREIMPETNDGINNLIAAVWSHLDPSAGGSITYTTTGVAPNRILVVSFNEIKYYESTDSVFAQILLYEGSNKIEIHTRNAEDCFIQTQGVENASGTRGVTVPGRNMEYWGAFETAYRFTPVVTALCDGTAQTVTVCPGASAVVPNFEAVAPVCVGTTLSPLPTTSVNGISGTWSPGLNNQQTTTYTFTPYDGQCATTTTMTITVNPNLTLEFYQAATISAGSEFVLPTNPNSPNGTITGTWSPDINNMETTVYTFTPSAGTCANTATMTVTITPYSSPSGQHVNTSFKDQMNTVFGNLDKSKMPDIVLDYGMDFEDLSVHNGILTDGNVMHRGKYTSIYNTLLTARVRTGVPGLVNPTTFKSNWNNLREVNKIVLSGLYYKYSQFKIDAPGNTITLSNGKLYDKYVNEVWQNPYDEKQVFAVSSPILVYNNLSMQVQLPASLWYTNQASSVQSIAIDFADGLGYQLVALDEVKNLYYYQAGMYEWKYKLTLTNGQILYSHSKIQVNGTAARVTNYNNNPSLPCLNSSGVDQVLFSGSRTYEGLANRAIIEIDYANNDCVIRKPLIVVEGFDSGLLGKENPLGEVDYRSFKNSFDFSGSVNLPAQLDTYDIIYINFMNGRDDIHRNAYLVEDIIKWVNSKKQGTLPNVVLGQSMGGLIARYALRDMENQLVATGDSTWNHQTSLYISHDAPHQGANIPLATQYLLRHVINETVQTPLQDMSIPISDAGISISIDDVLNLFEQPGTKQLMINYVNSGFTINNTAGDNWRTELKNMGYPQQTRNIAISNASHCANSQDFEPLDNLFSINGYAKTTFLTDLITSLVPIIQYTCIDLAMATGNPDWLAGALPGNSKFSMDFYGKALPEAGTLHQIYHGSLTYTKSLLGIYSWTVDLITPRNYSSPLGMSYDSYPGGSYQLFSIPTSGGVNNSDADKWVGYFATFGATFQIKDSFDFIPTPSALDVGNGQTTLGVNDYWEKYNKLNPPFASKTPAFDNYTTSFNTSGTNENHISFNTRNGDWLATELDNDADNTQMFDCTYVCSRIPIPGSDVICSTGSYSYSYPSWATAAHWSITKGANLVTLTGNSNPWPPSAPQNATLTPVGTGSGEVILEGTFAGSCDNVLSTKNIWVGNPPNFGLYPFKNGDCWNVQIVAPNMSPLSNNGGSTVVWTKLSGNGTLYPGTIAQICPPVFYIPGNGWTVTFKVELINACGRTEQILTLNNPTVTPPPGMENNSRKVDAGSEIEEIKDDSNGKYYVIYPNPSADIVNIETKNKNPKPTQDNPVSGELFDMKGTFIAKIPIYKINTTFSVKDLSKGVYNLKINDGYQTENHKIVVE